MIIEITRKKIKAGDQIKKNIVLNVQQFCDPPNISILENRDCRPVSCRLQQNVQDHKYINRKRKKIQTAREVENESKLIENQQETTSRIWNILSRLYSILSIFFVLLFLLSMTLYSLPSVWRQDTNGDPLPNLKLLVVQAVCVIEFIIRFLFSPNKFQFRWMNIGGALQRQHFPLSLRDELYVFGISRPQRMGIACKLIQIQMIQIQIKIMTP